MGFVIGLEVFLKLVGDKLDLVWKKLLEVLVTPA